MNDILKLLHKGIIGISFGSYIRKYKKRDSRGTRAKGETVNNTKEKGEGHEPNRGGGTNVTRDAKLAEF